MAKTEEKRIVQEESLKNKIARLYFSGFDCDDILGRIDFCVADKDENSDMFYEVERQYYLWAEAKRPHEKDKKDIYKLFVQLILTIGKSNALRNKIPPKYLGAFNFEKMAFLPYENIQHIFSQSDFNWNVTPSDYKTKEFAQLYNLVKEILKKETCIFSYNTEDTVLKEFIKKNFKKSANTRFAQIEITKNNFVAIYARWLKEVKDTIDIDWSIAKQNNVLDTDFYLADVLSERDKTIKDGLYVLLKGNHYEYDRQQVNLGTMFLSIAFKDDGKAHQNFWMKYRRPPKNTYQDYILLNRHLLVPQDVREIKGSYFTPQKWVELSQKYLAEILGENWQDEYYIWDCCAGTGNLLCGLTDKYRIWASTLDKADVDVMKDRIKNGANLLETHVFQMDFLNDSFAEKCPADLLEILNSPAKRKKLVIYINPPYAEATTATTITGNGKNKQNVAISNKTYKNYKNIIGRASNELFAQFFIRIYKEIPDCLLGEFSTLKILQADNFADFRQTFQAKLQKMFVVPADTFDNVKGQFPIGFLIWDTAKKEVFRKITADVYDREGEYLQKKELFALEERGKTLNKWIKGLNKKLNITANKDNIALLDTRGNDFQNQRYVYLTFPNFIITAHSTGIHCNNLNLLIVCIYFSVRHCMEANWLNDRDQFLYPKDGWQKDTEFQTDCLAYTLFHGQNHISADDGVNHWIPFTETEVEPRNGFASHFMTDFIKEKRLTFSAEAQAVFNAGRELWRYYHRQPNSNQNAAFYDIRAYFQGRDKNGRMNKDSTDTEYTRLIAALRQAQKILAAKISKKVYLYGFLKQA